MAADSECLFGQAGKAFFPEWIREYVASKLGCHKSAEARLLAEIIIILHQVPSGAPSRTGCGGR
jgi:hypothetical protein